MPRTAFPLVLVTMFVDDESGGIQAFRLDPVSGTLSLAAGTTNCPNSFFLAVAPDRRTVYSLTAGTFGVTDTEEVIAWRLTDRDGTLESLGRRSARGPATCYVATDPQGRMLLLAHYSGATIASLSLAADGTFEGEPVVVRHEGKGTDAARQEAPHPHSIIPARSVPGAPQFVLAADLGADAIFTYLLDATEGRLVANDPPLIKTRPGAGPRHLAFHPNGRRLYVMNELDNTVAVYDFERATGRLVERQVASTLPCGFEGTNSTADVKISPDGKFLYGTNRGHDSIVIYRIGFDGLLTLIEIIPSRGQGPQNLAVTPDGGLLLCANMAGDNVSVFRIDRDTGRLAATGDPVAITSPSCIAIVP